MSESPIQLRNGVAPDLDAIVALERATENAPHWPRATYAAILEQETAQQAAASQRCLIVASRFTSDSINADGLLVGFAVGLIHSRAVPREELSDAPGQNDCIAELESVVVAASARRAGVGRALCVAVLDWCRCQGATEVVLEVRSTSVAAIALYAGLGFTEAGRRPRYYRDPDDAALMMRLPLDGSA